MRCDVLLFAHLREAAGQDRVQLDLPERATAGDAIGRLQAAHPHLAGAARSIAIAVNERYVRPDHRLRDGDVIALIPPVSGG
jgi:molybdopterin converting factor subunit 1